MNRSLEEDLERYPRISLTRLPTPLQALPSLSAKLGPRLFIKRDDLTDLTFGGDKPRKLEYEVARALAQGADTLVTCGSSQSNHARLTTAAARKVGMDCVVILSRDQYQQLQGNLLTVYLMGAQVHLVETSSHWDLKPHVQNVYQSLLAQGRKPYVIPVSGTTPQSSLGYVRCGLEIARQMREQDLQVDAIYTPFGTGGIFTALLLSLREQGITCPLIGISVNQKRASCYEQLETWWKALCSLLDRDPGGPRGVFEIHDEFIGREYGDPTEDCLDAIMLMGRTEGILLDPVYSGKMMTGFLAHQAAGRWSAEHTILLLHSGGGPALFAYAEELGMHLKKRGVDILS
ncbi:1-aminocyclopropane-1-carboxylate deaminase/D-cysteine desulfhydrase [Ktedonobacter racemifer]|uniref:1-aminocyclopropane-1-carboxylate deaminase n=1 Tax=Ktedonobacter racemifer DSM 44963 TaxID=485913 RepID=D6TSX2_KTERA|nr:D-cysteine desulfhydrase family protein [Ktedonobacter racemifer]EFH83523.1 1-aminocyclopropane-1-carboxylate deaminase [Ktedonobacter racemifer DSM 44963]